MTTGDEIREAARKTRLKAQQNREKAIDMRKAEDNLIRISGELDEQVKVLERQAKESDDAEKHAKESVDKFNRLG